MAAPARRSRFSALSRRIILFNAFALVVLITGVLVVQTNRASLVDMAARGDLVVPVARTFPLDEAVAALTLLAGEHPGGKLALIP